MAVDWRRDSTELCGNPGLPVAIKTLLKYPVPTCAAESSFSSTKRLRKHTPEKSRLRHGSQSVRSTSLGSFPKQCQVIKPSPLWVVSLRGQIKLKPRQDRSLLGVQLLDNPPSRDFNYRWYCLLSSHTQWTSPKLVQFHSCNWSFFTKISTNCYSFFRPPFHLNIVGIQDCTPCYWLATIGWLQLYTCVFLFPFCCFAVSLCFALVHTFLIFIFIFQWFFVLFSYTFFLLWNIQRIDVKFIWNNSYLNCGCRWKWRMIIAVNLPI